MSLLWDENLDHKASGAITILRQVLKAESMKCFSHESSLYVIFCQMERKHNPTQ